MFPSPDRLCHPWLAGNEQMVRWWDGTQDTLTAIYGEWGPWWGQCTAACAAHHTSHHHLLRRGGCQWCEHSDLQGFDIDRYLSKWAVKNKLSINMQFFHIIANVHKTACQLKISWESLPNSLYLCQNLSTQFGVVSIWPRTRRRPWRPSLRSPEPFRKLDINHIYCIIIADSYICNDSMT